MVTQTVNVLLSSFPGLGLPPTLCLPVPSTATVRDVTTLIAERIPEINHRLLLTTNSNKELPPLSLTSIRSLLSSPEDVFIPLRLSSPLCGGKGGFGSQLRAAGGRMSSRKKRNQGENNGSNRNLDGRRLRTIAEAKALAEYLALKPEMDKQEKEERRRRWEQIVEMAERKQEEIRSGGKGRLDGDWVVAKEEAEEKTRKAVETAVLAGDIKNLSHRESDDSANGSGESEDSEEEIQVQASSSKPTQPAARTFFGWDEDEELSDSDMSDEETTESQGNPEPTLADSKGKRKA